MYMLTILLYIKKYKSNIISRLIFLLGSVAVVVVVVVVEVVVVVVVVLVVAKINYR